MNISSVMCVPLNYNGETQGVIYVDSIGVPGAFRKDDFHLLIGLANTASMAIKNARLYEAVKAEVDGLRKAERALREGGKELRAKTKSLEEVNTALRVLLKRRDADRAELEEKVLFNVRELVLPFLEKLKQSRLDSEQASFLHMLESNLNDIVSPFARRLSAKYVSLTPTEILVANLVKANKTTKEIAEVMNLSQRTIESYRESIRRKVGIKNKKANLRTYLFSLK
jgi:DNA-binding CsgD family transcriptional regulator